MTIKNSQFLASLPHAYRTGSNPAGDSAYFYCNDCGLELHGEEVGFVAAGPTYANGEYATCPSCGEEHAVYREDDE